MCIYIYTYKCVCVCIYIYTHEHMSIDMYYCYRCIYKYICYIYKYTNTTATGYVYIYTHKITIHVKLHKENTVYNPFQVEKQFAFPSWKTKHLVPFGSLPYMVSMTRRDPYPVYVWPMQFLDIIVTDNYVCMYLYIYTYCVCI